MISDSRIKHLMHTGEIIITPLYGDAVQPASIDLHINPEHLVQIKDEYYLETVNKSDMLVSSEEWIELSNNIAGQVWPITSKMRAGITTSMGIVDPGFKGNLTIRMSGRIQNPLPDTRLCQIVFYEVDQVSKGYTGKYQESQGVVGDRTREKR